MIKILDGKSYAKEKRNKVKEKVDYLLKYDVLPTLAVIQVGEDKASTTYVNNKSKACKEVGINFKDYHLSEDTSVESLVKLIDDLNKDSNVHGILIQQPVPNHLKGLEQYINPMKDVDGFCYTNTGKLQYKQDAHIPCTAKGIIDLLKYYNISLEGKHIVIIGRSNIVGKPVAQLALNENATVTICHSKTKDLECITQMADILIVAIGKPKMIDSSYISSEACVVVDVGINRDENNKLCGDCDYNDIINYWDNIDEDYDKLYNITIPYRFITPVPGGIGPLTIACLLENTINSAFYSLFDVFPN